jgi:glycosyltransferase involved in cell wall biosynthesis
MRIGIDCRLGGKTHAGIGRYIQNLVSRLPVIAPEIEWIYFCSDQSQAAELLADIKPGLVKVVITPVRHYSLAEQLKMPRFFSEEKLDLLHVPHFNIPLWYSGKMVVTIHDLLWHEYKGQGVTTLSPEKYWFKYLAYRWVATQAVRRSQAILVPARTIHDTIVRYYPEASSKVVITKEGASQTFLKAGQKKGAPKKEQTRRNLVYVGSLYPHKNVNVVIDALLGLNEYTLTIVGARTVFRDQVEAYARKKGVVKQVRFAGYLSDQELLKEYENALALVQPSLSEGFGLTGIEAMAAGIPVVASDIPIFQEIYQDAAQFFDPHSVDSFVAAVQRLAVADRSLIIKKGFEIARQYSWDQMAAQTLGVYKKVLQ